MPEETKALKSEARIQSQDSSRSQKGRRPARRGGAKRQSEEAREFEQKILDLARVTRVTAGGKRMSFRCALVIGDKKGRVGLGVAKGGDVQIAIEKAYKKAKKKLIRIPILGGTIPHSVLVKFGSAQVLIKPAPKGTGLKCGGAVRVILELGGLPNATSKILNSSNKINIAKAALAAIESLRLADQMRAGPETVKNGNMETVKKEKPILAE